jgi:hypothetical protein
LRWIPAPGYSRPGCAASSRPATHTCRTPYCDAPIRHHDHIDTHADGGTTSADNGAGLCAACNYAKQAEGWHAQPEPRAPGERHSYLFTTPTGHNYRSTAPPLPTPLEYDIEFYSPAELRLVDILYAA